MSTAPRICAMPGCDNQLPPPKRHGGDRRRYCEKLCANRHYKMRQKPTYEADAAKLEAAAKPPLPPDIPREQWSAERLRLEIATGTVTYDLT